MRQHAWLSTAPEDFKTTRFGLLERAGVAPEFPPVEWGFHLIEWLLGMGAVSQGVAGAIALPHSEIRAWSENIGLTFEDDEGEILHMLSAEYAQELHGAAKGRAPYVAPKG